MAKKKKTYNERFNTRLNDNVLKNYQKHAELFPSLLNDMGDYDTQGFYKNLYNTHKGDFNAITQALTPGSETEHIGTDKFKKPNHPTFSKESKYHIPIFRPGGYWQDNYFVASNRNIRNMNENYGSPMNYMQWAEDYDRNNIPDVGLKYKGETLIQPEQKAYGGKITNMKKNKLPKYQTGGPIDPNLSNRLMQYLFGRNTNKPSILDVRSPNEYGVSLGDRFNIQSGLSFDPMTGMPTGYGKVGINNKGFNLGLEKRKGQSTLNVGYNNPNFNIDATYSNTNKMPSVGGNVGFNTKGFNVGVGGNYSPDNKNISANVGYNNKGFNAGLNYDYSGQSSLSGNVGYGNDLFNVGLSGNYAPGDANINLNTTYNLGKRKKQKAEPIPLAFNTPEKIQLIKEGINLNSNEAAGPPKMFWGGKLAPQLFDLAANTLINGTTYAVTDMIKAIREPEREMRPTKMNTGFTMANGGVVNNDPKKKKKIKVNKKEYDVNSPEYRKLYESGLVSVDADGLPIVYQGSDEAWNEQFEKQRKKKGENAVRKGTGKFVKETAKLLPANPNEPDSWLENAIEITPTPLGRLLSADDMLLAGYDLATENKQGYLRNTLDLASPFLKVGDNPVNPQVFSQVANYYKQLKGRSQPILDALPFVANQIPNIVNYGIPIGGFADDVYQDNIAPMLPSKNKKSTPQNTNFATGEEEFAMGGMIKRADGSYSKRGLWDNIRANKGSGKKPTKQMLEQEKKIRAQMDNGGTVYPYQERLNQSLRQPGFNPNIMGMSTGRNNVGLGLRGGPFRQMTSLTNDRKLNPADNFTFNTDNSNPKFNLNTRLGYQDRFGFKGGVDYTSAIGENNPDTKFNVGFDKYGITGDYNYNLNKENPNFNYGVGYKGFGFDTDFRATKEKDELYNYDAKLGYDRGNTSGNFEFTGNRDDYNLGADFRINGVGTNFKYANKKNNPNPNNFKSNAGPENNSNFNLGLLNYDRNGLSANYAISRDNQDPLIHDAKLGYSKNGFDANLSFMGNKLDPKYNFNLNFVPEKAGPTTNADIDFKNNNLSIGTGLGYKSKKFNAGVNYKGSMDVEEETGKQSVNARAAYKGKNFNAGIDYDRQFATEENPAVNKAGLNLGYNKNGFNIDAGVKYKTLSEADKKKDKASPFEVKAGVTYNPNYKKPKQKTTPWKLPKELMKKNEVINLIDENSPTPQERMLNEFKSQFTPINLGKRAFGGMITPDMYMQQLMYGSYANGGQVPQNIPVEVEGGEAYELPNGEMGEFEGPSHDNGGIPVALPEQTKVYSKQLKVNGKTMADRKTKREANVAKLEKILSKNPSDKFVREALKRQQETAALEEQQDMAMQEQANQQQQMQEQAQQGMMQEQAMAGLMQDPAMMQQMGMMMYGGKLNKLANGGEPEPIPPYSLTNPFTSVYTAPQTGAYPQMTDANYAQMLKEKDYQHSYKYLPPSDKNLSHDMYSGYGKYPEYVYRNTYDKNAENLQWSYFNPKGKGTDWVNIDPKHPAFNELNTKVSGDNYDKYYMTREYPTEYPNVEPSPGFYLFGQPLRPKDILSKTEPQADLNSQKEDYLKAEEEKAKSQPKVVASAITTEPEPEPPTMFGKSGIYPGVNLEELGMKKEQKRVYKAPTPESDNKIKIGGQWVDNPYSAETDPPFNLPNYINTKKGVITLDENFADVANALFPTSYADPKIAMEPKGKNKFMNWLNKAADETGDFFTGLFDGKGKPKKEKAKKEGAKVDSNLPFTPGDYMGMAGTLFGGLAPMTTTMLNRMMTPKNQNFFREYGAEGLRAMQEAQALSGINRDKQLADIKLGEEASRQRGRNSARGVNTLRAMDIAADMGANQAQNQAYNSYAQQMMQLLGQKAQMENQQDQMVMKGEYDRDLADRQDVDNFYTNLAENFASQSELMQKQGKDMNQAKYNKQIMNLLPYLSKYGIGVEYDENDNVVTYDLKTRARLSQEETAKRINPETTKEKTPTVTPTKEKG